MKYSTIRHVFSSLLAVLLLMAPPDTTAAPPDSIDVPARSVYQLTSPWTTQNGATVTLADFRGRPQLVAMIYTRCGAACPLIVQTMKQVLDRLPDEQQAQVDRVLVSIDPERDTPERLRTFAETHALDLDRWTLLRGPAMQVRELAAVLDVRYQQEASGMFSHTSRLAVLDTDGVIVHQQPKINQGLDATAAALQKTLVAPSP